MASRVSVFLTELKRRKVYHVGAAYGAASIVLATATAELYQYLRLPEWTPSLVIFLLIVGFPIALVLAWAYEVRPEEPRPADQTMEEPDRTPEKAKAAPVAAAEERKSIVVLPFDNLSPDPADIYFSGGLTEEITATLSHLQSLRVISRSSAVACKETFKDVRTIARDLDVEYLLEGSVRKAGDNLRITVQLIDARNDEHLWAEKYDGKLEDVFGMQEQVSRSIVDSLKIRLNPGEERSLSAWPISDPRAYDTYLLAMHESRKLTEEGLTRAVNLIEDALSRVGENARLSAALAICKVWAYDFGISHREETLSEVEEWASKAIELNPDLGLAHFALAYARYKRGDLRGFVLAAKHSLELEQNSDAAALLAFVLSEIGKTDVALQYAESAVERDPLSYFAFWGMGGLEIFVGKTDQALSRVENAIGGFATADPFGLWWQAQTLGYAGEETRAMAVFERVSEMGAGILSDMSDLFARAIAGDSDGVRDTVRTDEYLPMYIASAMALVGDSEGALEWLEHAIRWGFTNHEFLSTHNRYLEPLWDTPAFEALMVVAREKQAAFDV